MRHSFLKSVVASACGSIEVRVLRGCIYSYLYIAEDFQPLSNEYSDCSDDGYSLINAYFHPSTLFPTISDNSGDADRSPTSVPEPDDLSTISVGGHR